MVETRLRALLRRPCAGGHHCKASSREDRLSFALSIRIFCRRFSAGLAIVNSTCASEAARFEAWEEEVPVSRLLCRLYLRTTALTCEPSTIFRLAK